jgi:hypothetical protein
MLRINAYSDGKADHSDERTDYSGENIDYSDMI